MVIVVACQLLCRRQEMQKKRKETFTLFIERNKSLRQQRRAMTIGHSPNAVSKILFLGCEEQTW